MPGWFEAFSSFARGAAPALDRYQMLRQLDTENQFKLRQQEFANSQEAERTKMLQQAAADRSELHKRQMEQIDNAILGQQRKEFTDYHMPGQSLTDEGAAQAQKIGLGDLVFNQPEIDISAVTGVPDVPNAGNLPSQFGPEFRQQNENIYAGTPADQAREQQRRLMMSVLGGLDPYARAQALSGGDITRPPVPTYRSPIRTQDNTYHDPLEVVQQGMKGYVPPVRPSAATQAASNIDQALVERGAQAVLDGRMSPSQAASLYGGMGGAGAAYKRALTDHVLKVNPEFDLTASESNYAYGRNPGTQTTVRFLDNIDNTIPIMRNMVSKMKLGNVKLINAATLGAKGQFGVGDVAAYNFLQTALADEFAKVLQGGGTGSGTSDTKLKQAMSIMESDMSPDQWTEVLDVAQDVLKLRRKALTSGTYMEDKKFGDNKKQGSKTTTPAAGTWKMIDGIYQFVPGDKK